MVVKVYGTSWCPACIKVKEYLKEKNVEFEDINVQDDLNAMKEFQDKFDSMSVPQIDFNGTLIEGFDKEKLDELI